MIGFIIEEFKILVVTAAGDYGFKCSFGPGLNVLRGDNSSGKSTFFNALIYSLGMEELIGGVGVKSLPYALKEYIEGENGEKIKIISSSVFIQLSNRGGGVITLKRPIVSDQKNIKLIEVILGPYLSVPNDSYKVVPTFLHDKGAAQDNDSGFFTYLERFAGMSLPKVSSYKGGEVKLYLQTIFAAFLVEQKRGWTDYIANSPYYAIRDVKTKVVEFILDFDVFENERNRAQILLELTAIQKLWSEEKYKIKLMSDNAAVVTSGIKDAADEQFESRLVSIDKLVDGVAVDVYGYIADILSRIEVVLKKESEVGLDVSSEVVESYSEQKNVLASLVSMFDSLCSDVRVAKARLQEYEDAKKSVEEDLSKNKIALKLKRFGAEQQLEIASDSCPSCHQHIDDSLLLADMLPQPMSIDENVVYLESQKQILTKYISGLVRAVESLNLQSKELSVDISERRSICLSLKRQLRAFDSVNESDIRLKIQLENKISVLNSATDGIDISVKRLVEIAADLKAAKIRLSSIPVRALSDFDRKKLQFFQSSFRELAGLFGYGSAPTADIEINNETYFPYLSGIELREVNTDIKSDSSASDFVRLIWSYLISLYAVSERFNGNHIGIIMFDEPAQHSMGVNSMNAMLKDISKRPSLQSIVAASFDESDDVFTQQLDGVEHVLTVLGRKLIMPLL
jgi:ribosome-associated translation inhibitor RaiA